MSDEKVLLEKLDELGSAIKVAQEKNDKLEEKHDGLLNVEIKNLADKTADMLEDINKINAEKKEREERITLLEKQASRLGKSTEEVEELNKKYSQQFNRYMRKGTPIDEDIIEEMGKNILSLNTKGLSDEEVKMQLKSLRVQVNPDGGYWVQPQRLTGTVDRVFETSPMRQVANVVTTTSDSVEMIIDDEEFSSGGWVNEEGTRSVTNNGQIGLLTIYAHEQYAEPRATQKMIDDAGFDLESWIAMKVNDKLARTENTAFIAGDGSSKPKGILSYSAWTTAGTYERGKLEQVKSGSNGAFTADGLISLQNSLIENYQSSAVFMLKRSFCGDIIKLKDSDNNYLINFAMMKEGTNQILLGRPVIFANDFQAKATGSLSAAYGDFGQGYTIVDRLGVRTIRDNVTAKPYVLYYTTKRVGGAVTNYEAIKVHKLSA